MSTAECAFCGRHRRVKDRVDGAARCATCLRRDPATWEECTGCHRMRPVNARTTDGGALCNTCYVRHRAPHRTCDRCGASGPVAVRAGGRGGHKHTLCERCVVRPRRPCGRCGRTRRIAVRATATTPDLCPTCHQAPVLTCSRCGHDDLCRTTGPGGAPVCFRCQLTGRLDQLLTAAPGAAGVPAELRSLRAAILAVDNPRTALGWLQRSPAARLLARLAAGELPLTHASLDQQLSRPAIEHLRGLLVAAGALPERDDLLARLHAHADALVDGLDHPADRALLRSYATWHLLRRVRARSIRAPFTPGAYHRARGQLTATARLLAILRAGDHGLASCTQDELDTALASLPDAKAACAFLGWARRQRLTSTSPPAWPSPQLPRDFIDDQQRWQTCRRLLHDDSIDIADRVAGLLVLLYGQRASRVSQLTVDDVSAADDGSIHLALGRERLLIPPPLAGLIRQLPDRGPAGMAATLAEHRWLFPGRRPDRPAHPATLMSRLARHDIPLRLARNAALLHLARELPPIIVADLLGVHVNTASRWTEAAGGRWMNYAAHRARQGPTHSASTNITSLPV